MIYAECLHGHALPSGIVNDSFENTRLSCIIEGVSTN